MVCVLLLLILIVLVGVVSSELKLVFSDIGPISLYSKSRSLIRLSSLSLVIFIMVT